jgi:hypothetical protein
VHAATTTLYKKMSSTDLADGYNPPLNAVAAGFTNLTCYDVMNVVSAHTHTMLAETPSDVLS